MNKKEMSELGLQILLKQKKEKRIAMEYILQGWNRLVDAESKCKTWFEVVPNCFCVNCGAPIFKMVGPFIPYTIDANPAIGCISCSSVSAAKTLRSRDDIKIVRENGNDLKNCMVPDTNEC